jgi:hypothetical protein
MSIKTLVALFLFAASSALAAVTVTSVTPGAGPVAGGTHVIIKGTGFSNNCNICSPPLAPPLVYFGGEASPAVTFIDSTTLEAVTPPHFPGAFAVTVVNHDHAGEAGLVNAFTFTGDLNEAFEQILFPIFSRPVFGAFNSEFHTVPVVWNKGTSPVSFYGSDLECYLINPPRGRFVPQTFRADQEFESTLLPDCSQSIGRVFWVTKGAELAANLRVADVSRSATSHGTEIPVVRRAGFTTGRIALLGVPADPRFRITLRIYSLAQSSDPVNIDGFNRQVFLTPGRDVFEPSYAVVSDLPRTMRRVVITSSPVPLWAFITVTNNETQHITTITP